MAQDNSAGKGGLFIIHPSSFIVLLVAGGADGGNLLAVNLV